jgi:hypothetical protein
MSALGWLIEMSYSVLTEAHHSGTVFSLGRQSSVEAN